MSSSESLSVVINTGVRGGNQRKCHFITEVISCCVIFRFISQTLIPYGKFTLQWTKSVQGFLHYAFSASFIWVTNISSFQVTGIDAKALLQFLAGAIISHKLVSPYFSIQSLLLLFVFERQPENLMSQQWNQTFPLLYYSFIKLMWEAGSHFSSLIPVLFILLCDITRIKKKKKSERVTSHHP